MALTLFGFNDRPHDFAITKADVPLDECVFLLDFARPLERVRWLGRTNKWIGPTLGLLVPVIHQSENTSEYVIGVNHDEPYFADLLRLWKQHAGSRRTLRGPSVHGPELIADFARHFPGDSR